MNEFSNFPCIAPANHMPPHPMHTSSQSCMCPDCNSLRWHSAPHPAAPINVATRKYTHNPYALAPIFPSQINSSAPPIVTPDDALASIVPNFADFELGRLALIPPASTSSFHPQPLPLPSPQVGVQMGGNSIVDQFHQSIGMVPDVACTTRGRSLLQAILRLQQPIQIKQIIEEMCSNETTLIRMMVDGNACHVIRSILEVMDPSCLHFFEAPQIMSEAHILHLATNSQHTRRILQSFFERFHSERCCDRIAAVLAHHAQYLATTQQGCIALMRVVEHAQPNQKNQIHESLFPSMVSLASDPYGNYVIQHSIERGDNTLISNAVLNYFLPSVVHLCCNKFASNVMEKVLYSVNPSTRRALVESMTQNQATLQAIMNDGYGNFVIQATIDSCTNYLEYRKLADRMRPHMHTSPYGHKIDAKLRSKRTSQTLVNGSTVVSATSSAANTAPSTPRNTLPTVNPPSYYINHASKQL